MRTDTERTFTTDKKKCPFDVYGLSIIGIRSFLVLLRRGLLAYVHARCVYGCHCAVQQSAEE